MRPPLKFLAQRVDHFQDRFGVGAKRGMGLDPGFRVRQGFEDPAAVAEGAIDDSLIGQEKQDPRSASEWQVRPVCRVGEIVFEMKANIARGFFNDGEQMLVIAMLSIKRQFSVPGASQMADE
jgi:hypothetical protein